jgi:hypothetical protein
MTRWGNARLPFVGGIAMLALVLTTLPSGAAPAEAFLTVLHGLPRFTADVYVNGDLTLDGFEPESVTEPLALPAGTYEVAIRNVGDAETADPVLEGPLTLEAGANYTAVAHLDEEGQPALTLFRNDLSSVPAGSSHLVIRNAADSPALQVDLDGEQRFAKLRPKGERDAVLPAGTYSIAMGANDGTSIGPMPVQLAEGSAQIVYVIGSASDGTLDLMIQAITALGSTPTDVLTGTGGAAAPPGLPIWALALLTVAAAALVVVLVDAVGGRSRADRVR